MTYEWGWSGGPPMPVAPIKSVRRGLVMRALITKKKNKMGMPCMV